MTSEMITPSWKRRNKDECGLDWLYLNLNDSNMELGGYKIPVVRVDYVTFFLCFYVSFVSLIAPHTI